MMWCTKPDADVSPHNQKTQCEGLHRSAPKCSSISFPAIEPPPYRKESLLMCRHRTRPPPLLTMTMMRLTIL
eukprot:scaffold1234_cov190-Alexandrium_tamarense.AAC.16